MNPFKRKKLASLPAAEAVLEKRDKLQSAIETERVALRGRIDRLERANRELADAEVAAAVGEANEATLEAAKQRVADARALIDAAGLKLKNLRSAVNNLGTELADVRLELKNELGNYGQSVRSEFEAEWRRGVQEFSRLLSKRAALEKMWGQTLEFPEPAATPMEIAEQEPYTTLAAVEQAIDNIAARARRRRVSSLVIEPHQVFVMRRLMNGCEAGEKVIAASLDDGELADMVSLDIAVPVDTYQQRGIRDAVRAQEARIEERAQEQGKKTAAWIKDIFAQDAVARDKELKRLYPHCKTPEEREAAHSEALKKRFVNERDPHQRARLDDILTGAR